MEEPKWKVFSDILLFLLAKRILLYTIHTLKIRIKMKYQYHSRFMVIVPKKSVFEVKCCLLPALSLQNHTNGPNLNSFGM